MADNIFEDVFETEVVLIEAVHDEILNKHPEVETFFDHVKTVLLMPDEVRYSIQNKRVVLYYRYFPEVLNGKWVVVAVKRIDRNFVATIYATDRIKSGDVIWKR